MCLRPYITFSITALAQSFHNSPAPKLKKAEMISNCVVGLLMMIYSFYLHKTFRGIVCTSLWMQTELAATHQGDPSVDFLLSTARQRREDTKEKSWSHFCWLKRTMLLFQQLQSTSHSCDVLFMWWFGSKTVKQDFSPFCQLPPKVREQPQHQLQPIQFSQSWLDTLVYSITMFVILFRKILFDLSEYHARCKLQIFSQDFD